MTDQRHLGRPGHESSTGSVRQIAVANPPRLVSPDHDVAWNGLALAAGVRVLCKGLTQASLVRSFMLCPRIRSEPRPCTTVDVDVDVVMRQGT